MSLMRSSSVWLVFDAAVPRISAGRKGLGCHGMLSRKV